MRSWVQGPSQAIGDVSKGMVLNAHARTKIFLEAPSKPQGTGGNGGKIETTKQKVKAVWNCYNGLAVMLLRSQVF